MKSTVLRRIQGILILILVSGFHLLAQNSFLKSYGGDNDDRGQAAIQTNDGGFCITGYTNSFGAGPSDWDIYVIRTDDKGDTLWTKTYGGAGSEWGRDIRQTSDNGFIIVGNTNSFGGKQNVYVIKTDENGDTLWTTMVGGSEDDHGYAVQVISDGYIIAGDTKSKGAGESDLYLIKLGTAGNVVWDKTFGGADPETGRYVEQTSDNGFIICGAKSIDSGYGYYDKSGGYLVKTDANGDLGWTKIYDEGWWLSFQEVHELPEGGYIITGNDEMSGILYKMKASGDKIWSKAFYFTNHVYDLYSLIVMDSSYLMAGAMADDEALVIYDFYLVNTDTSGNKIWEKTYGEPTLDEMFYSIDTTDDGGFILCGLMESPNPTVNYNVGLVKLDTSACINPTPIIAGDTTMCDGESVSLMDTTGTYVSYLWSTGETTETISVPEAGEYTLTVTDHNGCKATSDTFTIVNKTPRVTLQANDDTVFCDGDSVEIVAVISNWDPGSSYQYQWSDGSNPLDSAITVKTPGLIHVNVLDNTFTCSNKSDTIEVIVGYPYDNQEICLVGVDLETGKNMVIWEKHEDNYSTVYNIYRETKTGGQYEVIATIPYSDLSVYVDTTSEPEVKSHKYRISVMDTCGNESSLSPYHKTMLLTSSLGADRINLNWQEYEVENGGFGFVSYIIYRGPSPTLLEPIDTIPSDNTIYPDIDPPVGDNYYRIAGVKAVPCYPTGNLKAGTGPYSHSMSNIEDNRLQAPAENQAPTDITLSNTTVDENMPAQTLIGRFTTTDPDPEDIHTYAFISGTGDIDNSHFIISGDSLLSGEVFDYETKNVYSIRINTTDTGSLTFEKQITIFISNVSEPAANQAPTDITLDMNTIDENEPAGSLVGRLTTTDPDAGDTHTYSLVSGTGDDDNSIFSISADSILTKYILDYETKNSFSIRIKTTDSGEGNLSFEKQITISVNNLIENQAPTDISMDVTSIDENAPAGSLVGRLTTTDPDAGNTHVYSLVAGTGDDNNSDFTITNDSLLTAVVFDFETKNSYSVRIKTTDSGEGTLSFEKSFSITVNDVVGVGLNQITGKEIKIYPNPLNGSAIISFPNPDGKEYTLLIRDLSGKVVFMTKPVMNERIILERGNLASGYYIIELRGDKIYRGKLVVE